MSYRKHYSSDPRWLAVRWPGKCAGCGAPIRKGYDAYYYPLTKTLYGKDCGCGDAHCAEFQARAFDEDIAASPW